MPSVIQANNNINATIGDIVLSIDTFIMFVEDYQFHLIRKTLAIDRILARGREAKG